MPSVEHFGRDVLQRFVANQVEKDLFSSETITKDDDGDFRVTLPDFLGFGYELQVWFIVEGALMTVTAWIPIAFPKSDWLEGLTVCNEWNCEKRWPKAVFHKGTQGNKDHGDIRLVWQIDLTPGIHQELFDHLASLAFAGCFQFWHWAHDTHSL